jgi:hypothetical protein
MTGFLIILLVVSGLGWLIGKLIGWFFVKGFFKDEKEEDYYKHYKERSKDWEKDRK